MYEEAKWAMPRIAHLKEIMRHCYENQEEVKRKGGQAHKDSLNWTWTHSAKKAIEVLKELS